MGGQEGDRVRGGALGLGMLVMAASLALGASRGCTKAELLAINDDGACSGCCAECTHAAQMTSTGAWWRIIGILGR